MEDSDLEIVFSDKHELVFNGKEGLELLIREIENAWLQDVDFVIHADKIVFKKD